MKLILEGLNCANCAEKIVKELNGAPGVESAVFNIATKRLNLTCAAGSGQDFFSLVRRTVHYYEPGVTILEEKSALDVTRQSKSAALDVLRKNAVEIIGILIFIAALFIGKTNLPPLLFFIPAYMLTGKDVLLKCARNLAKGKIFDENFLMTTATIGAFLLGDFTEAAGVMLFYKIGEALSDYAHENSVRSISSLLDLKVPYADLLRADGAAIQIPCEEIKTGDRLRVAAGDLVPVDATIEEGGAYFDTKAITGESVSVYLEVGDKVFEGYIVTDRPVTIVSSGTYEDSMLSKIIYLTKEAAENKSRTEKFITKFASYYTPAVVLAAFLISVLPPLFGAEAFSGWIRRGLLFLVISCPCALVLSVPLCYFAAVGSASRSGILIKGDNVIDALRRVKAAVFDKTGTLTRGELRPVKIETTAEEKLFCEYLAAAEQFSKHPVALALTGAYGKNDALNEAHEYEEHPGKGVSLMYKGVFLKAGTAEYAGARQMPESGTSVYLSADGEYLGRVILRDTIKPGAREALELLKKGGVSRTYMFTGDNQAAAEAVADHTGIDEISAKMLPAQKVKALSKIKVDGTVMYVGDGINDAPVIAAADVGVAMAALGSDAAIESADVVIMSDNLSALAKAMEIARFTSRIIVQNITLILIIKFGAMLLGAFGLANMAHAVFADVGTALLSAINSMRIIRKYK